MKNSQHVKGAVLFSPSGATIATTTTTGLAVIDRQGYGRLRAVIIGPAATNTSGANQPRAITIQDSSTTDASNFGTFKVGTTNTTAGTSDFTIEANGNTVGFTQVLDLDVREAQRYIRILITPANSTVYDDMAVWSELSEGNGPATSYETVL